jgi:hypothetical protein
LKQVFLFWANQNCRNLNFGVRQKIQKEIALERYAGERRDGIIKHYPSLFIGYDIGYVNMNLVIGLFEANYYLGSYNVYTDLTNYLGFELEYLFSK